MRLEVVFELPSSVLALLTFSMIINPLPPTAHRSARPEDVVIDTVVVHSMAHPEAPTPEELMSCVERLSDYAVSAHYFIERSGGVWCLVPPEECAWHAGVSRMPSPDQRERLNDFSIGIELIALPENAFTDAQYRALGELLFELYNRFPIRFVVAHSDVAMPPGRKTDPGGLFSWERVIAEVSPLAPQLTFPGR